MKKNRFLLLALILLLAFSLSSCATTHLWRWGFEKDSVVDEPADRVSAAFLKPSVTVLGTPAVFVWDAVTFPFQYFWDVHPYGDRFMSPDTVSSKRDRVR